MPESPSQRDNPGEDPAGQPKPRDNSREILKYAGLTTQVFLAVGLSLLAGIKADKWLGMSFALFSWALPLLTIVALIVKLIKETSGHRNGH